MPKLSGVAHRRAVKVFEKVGCWVVREGKHISMTNGERIKYVFFWQEILQSKFPS